MIPAIRLGFRAKKLASYYPNAIYAVHKSMLMYYAGVRGMRFAQVFRLFHLCLLPVLIIAPDAAAQKNASQLSQSVSVEAEFRKWINSLVQGDSKFGVADIKYDDASDSLIVRNLRITWPPQVAVDASRSALRPFELEIGALTFRSFRNENQAVRFEAATLEQIRLGSPGSSYGDWRVARLEFGKTFLPPFAGFSSDPSRPVSGQFAFMRLLTKVESSKAVASGVDYNAVMSIAGVTIENVAQGKLARVDLRGLHSSFNQGVKTESNTTERKRELSITMASLIKVDLDPYIRLFEPSAYFDAGSVRPWATVIDALDLQGINFVDGEASSFIVAAAGKGLKLRQFSEDLTGIFDRAQVEPAYLDQNKEIAAKVVREIRSSLSLEASSLDDLSVTAPGQGGDFKVKIKSAALSNVTPDRVDQLEVGQLSLADPTATIALAKLNLGGFSFATLFGASSKEFPTANPTPSLVLPTVNSLFAEGLNVKSEAINLSLDKIDIAMNYFIGAIPTSIRAKIDHLKFATDQMAQQPIRQALIDFGYQNVDLSVNLNGSWEDSSSSLAFDAIDLNAKDAGSLSISGVLTGITRASMENPGSVLVPELLAGGIRSIRISFENNSLFERFIAVVAKQNAKSVDEIKKLISSNMQGIMSGISPPELRNRFVFAAVSFINDPQVFSLTSRTSETISLQDVLTALQEPTTLPRVLKLDASSNARKR